MPEILGVAWDDGPNGGPQMRISRKGAKIAKKDIEISGSRVFWYADIGGSATSPVESA